MRESIIEVLDRRELAKKTDDKRAHPRAAQ